MIPKFGDPRLPRKFWDRCTLAESGCWVWIGSRRPNGYGCLWFNGRTSSTHRVAYLALRGDVQPGLQLDHLCRNRACCNPIHLEAVTASENVQRGDLSDSTRRRYAGITHCPSGHEYTPENSKYTRRAYKGEEYMGRECRECHRISSRARMRKKLGISADRFRVQP